MKGLHYGWIVCLAGALTIFITMGTVSNGFAVYLPYIMDEYGLTNGQTSSLVMLRCLVAFFSMLLIRFFYDRVSLRIGIFLSAFFAGTAFVLYSFAGGYGLFCLGAAISGLAYGLGSMIPISILMGNWFYRRRALSLSICGAGSGIATIFLPLITTRLVESSSLKTSFTLEGAAIWVLAVILVILIRNDPSEKGLRPYGQGAPGTEKADARKSHAGRGLSPGMWVAMCAACLVMGGLANPGFSHLTVLFDSEGISAMDIALVISVVGVMIVIGKLLYGEVTDRVGGLASTILFGGILIAGHVMCCLTFTGNKTFCFAGGVALGLGYALCSIGPSVWAGDLEKPQRYGDAVRRFQVTYAGGALAFSAVPGVLADLTGSYIPSYILFSVFNGISLLIVVWAYLLSHRKARADVRWRHPDGERV